MRLLERTLALVGLAVWSAGCGVLRAGGDPAARPFADPELDFALEATAHLDSLGASAVDAWTTWPVRVERGDSDAQRIRWTLEVLALPDGEQLHESSWTDDGPPLDATVVRRVPVPAGAALVIVTAEDEERGDAVSRRAEVRVPSTADSLAVLGLRVEAWDDTDGWGPQVGRVVSVTADSLRIRAQVLSAEAATAQVTVERLDVDIAVAAPPSAARTSRTPARLGVQVRDTSAVVTARVDAGVAEVTASLPRLDAGTYRIRFEHGDARQDLVRVARRADFPVPRRIGDLVGPMAYLATEAEMRALASRLDPYLQRRAFDRFWGERLSDRRDAAAVVRAFAERVEAANRLFSTQKEGWKTDRGMASIVFGMPTRVETFADRERWTYGAGPVSGLALDFVRDADGLFETWTLARGPAYDVSWRRARRAWRRGDVP